MRTVKWKRRDKSANKICNAETIIVWNIDRINQRVVVTNSNRQKILVGIIFSYPNQYYEGRVSANHVIRLQSWGSLNQILKTGQTKSAVILWRIKSCCCTKNGFQKRHFEILTREASKF